jgi:hypothetical protein
MSAQHEIRNEAIRRTAYRIGYDGPHLGTTDKDRDITDLEDDAGMEAADSHNRVDLYGMELWNESGACATRLKKWSPPRPRRGLYRNFQGMRENAWS